MLAACAGSDAPELAAPADRPVLPAPPVTFGRPVRVREPHAGEDARTYAARERAGRIIADRRLVDDAAFYADVRARFGAPVSPAVP